MRESGKSGGQTKKTKKTGLVTGVRKEEAFYYSHYKRGGQLKKRHTKREKSTRAKKIRKVDRLGAEKRGVDQEKERQR